VEDAAKTSRRGGVSIDGGGYDAAWGDTILKVLKILIGIGALALVALTLLANLRAQNKPKARAFELTAASPKFWDLFEQNAKLATVASGFGFTEGPVWDPTGFLFVSDEETNKIFRLYIADGRKEEFVSLGDPDGNTYDLQHHLIDCASVLRAIIQLDDKGRYTVLADRYEGKKFNSPNDVLVGPDGTIYFTDPTLDLPKGEKQEIPFQGVYRLGPAGQVQLLTKELSQPNGLAFSPDGKKFYVDDSEQRNIRVYDFGADGSLKNGRIFGEEPGGKGDGVPDGIKVDKQGNLYVTGPGGIWIWDSEGHHLGTIHLPEQPANLAWGDADYSSLYITATTSVYRVKTKARGYVPYLPKRH
jgi:gluconolactonase